MWYILLFICAGFELIFSSILPLFPVEVKVNDDITVNENSFWQNEIDKIKEHPLGGVAILEYEDETELSKYPDVMSEITSDEIASGVNPLEAFIGIHAFTIVDCEWVGAIFWVCDIVIVICGIVLIRGNAG